MATTYQSQKNYPITFRIPIFPNMPATASPQPAKSDKINNYYIMEISVPGLTPSFEKFTNKYSLKVSSNTTLNVTIPAGAKITSNTSFNLVAGDNTVVLTVTSETGFANNYTLNVNSSAPCVLNLAVVEKNIINGSQSGPPTAVDKVILKGDTNGDNAITLRDLANVRLHLLGLLNLQGDNATGADTNGDGQIALRDLANVRLHLLGLVKLNG